MNIGKMPNCLCQIDLGQTVMACTVTWPRKAGSAAGSTDLIIGIKQAASYSNDDLVADDWEVNMLDGGPTSPSWMRISAETIDDNGNSQGSYSDSNGNTSTISGQFAISANGEVTCISGNNCPDLNYNPDFVSYMDASKTIIVGTYGVSATNPDAVNPDAVLGVFTKMAPSGSYSMNDLVGIWNFNILASGSGAPFWDRGTFSIKPDGTSTISSVQSDGKKKTETGPTFTISSDGVITGGPGRAVMNAGKTVMVETDTWQDGSGTTEIGVWTKSAGLPGAPTGVSATPENKKAKVSFTQAAANGSNITGYTVTSSVDPTHPNGITVHGTKSPITVTGLTNGWPYTFTVAATDAVGIGPGSSSSSVTPATKPNAPTIGVITVGTGQATVNFTETSDGGSPTTYSVTSNPKGGVDGGAGTASLSHLVTGLTSGKKYTFTVTATNAFGKSSSTSKSVTIE